MGKEDNVIRLSEYSRPWSANDTTGRVVRRDDHHWDLDDLIRIIFDFGDHDQPHSKSIGCAT